MSGFPLFQLSGVICCCKWLSFYFFFSGLVFLLLMGFGQAKNSFPRTILYKSASFFHTSDGLTEVPEIPKEAKNVFLTSNKITHLKARAFSSLLQCSRLELWNNSISVIDEGAFTGLGNLTYLGLQENQLLKLTQEMFMPLQKLEHLDVSFNNICTIEKGAFAGLYKLKKLQLSGNRVTTLNVTDFLDLPRTLIFYLNSAHSLWDCKSLCWIKVEVQSGTAKWGNGRPKCTNNADLEDMVCSQEGWCVLLY